MRLGRSARLTTALSALGCLLWASAASAADGEIHGKVSDHLGQPIAGITVCAEGLTPFLGADCDWETDAEGEYAIAGLAEGSYRLGFHVEGKPSLNYVPQWHSGKAHPDEADPVSLAGGESKEIDAQLQAGGQIRGSVLDSETDLPIASVLVCADVPAFHQTGEIGYCARSDADGEFTIRNLGTGEYRLEFQTEGEVNYVEELVPAPPGTIPLAAGGVLELEAHLVPGIRIAGTVTDQATGAPIAGLPPSYSPPAVCALDPSPEARVKCASVEADGHYSIPGLPAGTYAVGFGIDYVSEGMVLHPDGYVRRYWEESASFEEAALLGGSAGAVFEGVDAALTEGDEVFPRCEVPSACAPPPVETVIPPVRADAVLPTATPPEPPLKRPPRRPGCKKGFHRVAKRGKTRCVKVAKDGRGRSHRGL